MRCKGMKCKGLEVRRARHARARKVQRAGGEKGNACEGLPVSGCHGRHSSSTFHGSIRFAKFPMHVAEVDQVSVFSLLLHAALACFPSYFVTWANRVAALPAYSTPYWVQSACKKGGCTDSYIPSTRYVSA
eukprot:358234-Chlamydomonas_euryale.AAC.7